MRTAIPFALAAIAVVGFSRHADAKHAKFRSAHPMPPAIGGFCTMEVAHEHPFAPHDARLYRTVGRAHVFIGDPVPFGYVGARFAFYDPHPVAEVSLGVGEPIYCYLEGPHYHGYQPTAAMQFSFSGGAYFFVGTFPPAFHRHRPRYVVINRAYRPIRYARPVVDLHAAPPGWRGRAVPPGHAKRARTSPPVAPSARLGGALGVQLDGRGGPPARSRGKGAPPGHGKHRGRGKN